MRLRRLSAETQRLAAAVGDLELERNGQAAAGVASLFSGDLESARASFALVADRPEPASERSDGMLMHRVATGGSWLGWTLWLLGYPDQARAASGRAVEQLRMLDQPFDLAYALAWHSICEWLCGAWERAEASGLEALALVDEHGLSLSIRAIGKLAVASARGMCGDETAIAMYRTALQELGETNTGGAVSFAFAPLVSLQVAFGRGDEAMETADFGLALSEQVGERTMVPELERLRGEAMAMVDGGLSPRSEDALRAGLALAIEMHARSLELRAATSLARLDPTVEARSRLAAVSSWFTEGHDTRDLRRAAELIRDPAPSGSA